MNIKWFKYLREDESKETLKSKILGSREVLDILKRVLEDEVESTRRNKLNKAHYMMPAWSEFQADRNATERTLQQVIDLLPKD